MASINKVTLHDWLQLVSVVLEYGPQIQWKYYWREEAKALEHQGRTRGSEASKVQILMRAFMLIWIAKLHTVNTSCPCDVQRP